MKKVCIATYEIEKIHKNGGIATAYKNLATTLTSAGFDVTIFVTANINIDKQKLKTIKESFNKENIKLLFPKEISYEVMGIFNTYCSYQAYRTFETLKDKNFDILHIPDSSGDAYFIVHAKKAGLYFQNTTIIVGAHGSSQWVRESNEDASLDSYSYVLDHMERDSIAYADYIVSPSRYYIKWMQEHDFVLPKNNLVILNCPHRTMGQRKTDRLEAEHIQEIVFFGRQERRKGFDIFCQAVLHTALPKDVGVTFLGKPTRTCSFETYRQAFEEKNIKVKFIENYNTEQALAYLASGKTIAAIPSRSETMCYTVMECLLDGIPFIAAATGAIPELIDKQWHEEVLFKLDWQTLAAKLSSIFSKGLSIATPSFDNDTICQTWVALHRLPKDITMPRNPHNSDVTALDIKGNILGVIAETERSEYLFDNFSDQRFVYAIAAVPSEKILLTFNTDIVPSMLDEIRNSKYFPEIAIPFSTFNCNGALLGTSTNKERFELIGSDPIHQFSDALPIPNCCLVEKKHLLEFVTQHGEEIQSSYYFMKILLCFLKSKGVTLHPAAVACGWSESLDVEQDFENIEKMLWLHYYRKMSSVHPNLFSFDGVRYVHVERHKNLSREEKLRQKFITSPKRFCADSKHLSLRILSKFLTK